MRVIWIILLVILMLLVLLCLTRIGVQAALINDDLRVDIKISLFRFRILPEKKQNKKKEKASSPNTGDPKAGLSGKKRSKISVDEIKNAVNALWPSLKKALARTRRGVCIHPLTVSLTLGAAEDPAAGAELYGYCHTGVWTVMPVLEQLLVIPDPSIHVGIDFDELDTKVEGKLGLSARIGTLLRIVLTVAIPGLRWFLKRRKKTQAAREEQGILSHEKG